MWLWASELYDLGFRRRSERYWQCERRYGLPPGAHLSLYSWSEQALPGGNRRPPRFLVELTEFHVTFLVGHQHIHFYYHEYLDGEWHAVGHTSRQEIERLRQNVVVLRERADDIAGAVVNAVGGVLAPRIRGPCSDLHPP